MESLLLSERWEALLKVLCWVAALNSLIVSSACRWCAESVWKKEEMEKLSAAVKKKKTKRITTNETKGRNSENNLGSTHRICPLEKQHNHVPTPFSSSMSVMSVEATFFNRSSGFSHKTVVIKWKVEAK